MPDIRKMLEKQLENLQDASMNPEATADCTYAMLAIVDVLYPNGIPEKFIVENLVSHVEIDAEKVASSIANMLSKEKTTLIGKSGSIEIRMTE